MTKAGAAVAERVETRESIEDRLARQSYTLTAPAGRTKSSKGVATGTFELFPVVDPQSGEIVASVQFVNGVTVITPEIAESVGFPQPAARLDSEDPEPGVLPPAEALARQIVADYGYKVRPEFPKRVMRRGSGKLGGIFADPKAAQNLMETRQIPLVGGIAPGSDPRHAVTRPLPEPKGGTEKD